MIQGNAKLGAVEFPKGIVNGCAGCRKVLTRGTWAIGVIIYDGGTEYKYLLGYAPKLTCCGTEKTAIRAFASAEEAEAAMPEVRAIMERDRTTENVPLLEAHFVLSSTSH